MRLLVTGGAGYIGSVCAAKLLATGHEVVVVDDLSLGHRGAVPPGARLEEVDLLDLDAVRAAVRPGLDGVLHFAARSLVEESTRRPELYWRTNVGGTRNLLDAVREAGIPRFVFSSTCAVYGEPEESPITEATPPLPVNPYGASKLAVDRMISDEAAAHGLAAVSLRYFNVAGASDGLGEDHRPETHLIPLVLEAAAGRRERVTVNGTDYPTPDGTAIRDYVHVEDLAEAHVLALEAATDGGHRILNLGSGSGFSVRQVVETARAVTGVDIPALDGPRRPGDPPRLVAGNQLIRAELRWRPTRDLRAMIADAWAWHRDHPGGYAP